MSTAVTMERLAGMSPRLKARLAGVIYLLTGVVAFDEFAVLGRLVVHGDPAATAANILAHQTLFRLGFAAQIIAQVLQIPWMDSFSFPNALSDSTWNAYAFPLRSILRYAS